MTSLLNVLIERSIRQNIRFISLYLQLFLVGTLSKISSTHTTHINLTNFENIPLRQHIITLPVTTRHVTSTSIVLKLSSLLFRVSSLSAVGVAGPGKSSHDKVFSTIESWCLLLWGDLYPEDSAISSNLDRK